MLAEINSMTEAESVSYSLSEPSKMPCFGYSIPAQTCKVGSVLREIKNSVCANCYALKGRYVFPNVRKAMETRFKALSDPLWVSAMSFMINFHAHSKRKKPVLFFRWHDSGDLQGVWHLRKITEVCLKTPKVQHWLPTREIKIVRQFISDGGIVPANLIIRLSSPIVGTKIKSTLGLPVSTVGYNGDGVFQCGAYTRQGKCGPCRACWTDKNVNYPLH